MEDDEEIDDGLHYIESDKWQSESDIVHIIPEYDPPARGSPNIQPKNKMLIRYILTPLRGLPYHSTDEVSTGSNASPVTSYLAQRLL